MKYENRGEFYFAEQMVRFFKTRVGEKKHSSALGKRIIQRLSQLKTRCRQEYHYHSKCTENINKNSIEKIELEHRLF